MPKTIYLVRHGQTAYNKKGLVQGRRIDAPLDATGIRQAKELAVFLKDKPLDAIYCSRLQRTLQTAEPTARDHHLSPVGFTELDELDYGDLEGTSTKVASSQFYTLRESWEKGNISEAAPNGESPEDVLSRADAKCRELISISGNDAILFVIHGRLIRILLSVWLGRGLQKMHTISHANGAVNVLQFHRNKFTALELNITKHLSDTLLHA